MDKNEQLITIKTVIGNCSPVDENDLDRLLMIYITDMSYDRGIICQARKELLKEINKDP